MSVNFRHLFFQPKITNNPKRFRDKDKSKINSANFIFKEIGKLTSDFLNASSIDVSNFCIFIGVFLNRRDNYELIINPLRLKYKIRVYLFDRLRALQRHCTQKFWHPFF